MSQWNDEDFGEAARQLRVATLLVLRWASIVGQAAAILYVYFHLKFKFPIGHCFVVLASSAALNLVLRVGAARTRLDDVEAALVLSFDILQLAALLYFTGGLINPFAMFFLAPIMISAVSLPRNVTAVLGILTIAAATFLTVDYEPLPWRDNEELRFPLLYRLGVWAALTVSASFIGLYAARVSDEARRLAAALVATELVLEREQHLTQLDGLAAAAAHELGTPLATITLTISELQKAAQQDPEALREDLSLLAQEARRCREILRKLNSLGTDEAAVPNLLPIDHLIAEVIEPLRDQEIEMTVIKEGDEPIPVCQRNPGILYGLGNLVENATDFAKSRVRIRASWSESLVRIVIEDDGPGFGAKILQRIGDPYVSEASSQRRIKNDHQAGLGLGLFIAKTLLERSGAVMEIVNFEAPRTGALITLSWPRRIFERRVKA